MIIVNFLLPFKNKEKKMLCQITFSDLNQFSLLKLLTSEHQCVVNQEISKQLHNIYLQGRDFAHNIPVRTEDREEVNV